MSKERTFRMYLGKITRKIYRANEPFKMGTQTFDLNTFFSGQKSKFSAIS